ncbi:stage V sporulation protein E [Fictibacillus macauensis ZFHKF-1]|uniref:Probable peptidoglycan glycosyltransferase FtsW n=1 Tax=Fictibacillus macauensis ZFHKF-1 TaxID=1196324 RepID=I8AHK7_9BACL|nr:putative lipid II flippase FtsW [Fictibacillus macauensis]EIT84929.1 stage V sporulation protein E [Fictibacillus macauensis ZFHKF-1]
MVKKMFKHYDYTLIVAIVLLCALGLLMVYSASEIVSINRFGYNSHYFFTRQAVFLAGGLLMFGFFMMVPFQLYKKMIVGIVFGCILLLLVVLLIGKTSNNAQSWIYIGGVGFQPAEVVKLGLTIYLAAIFSKRKDSLEKFSASAPPLIVFAVMFLLIMKQPDLGTGMIIAAATGIVILCSNMRARHKLLLIVAALVIIGAGSQVLSSEQLSRFTAAYSPFQDPQGDGFQLVNSYIAIGHGGVNGSGLGQSIQKYGFLPEPHTDFIISIVAEELGFWGVAFVMSLLAFVVWKGFIIGLRSRDSFGSLLAFGLSGIVGIQAIVNLGAAIGLLPVTGVPLPFVSYGGSSLVLLLISMGILVNISCHVNYKRSSTVKEVIDEKTTLKAV